MATVARLTGNSAVSTRAGVGLTPTHIATLRNGPIALLVRFLAGDEGGEVTLANYDAEVGPYGELTWTVASGSAAIAVLPVFDGVHRHPNFHTSTWRATLETVAP